MKRYVALLVTFFYCTTNLSFALSELYCLKNADISTAKAITENEFIKENLFIVRDNPIIGMSYMNDNMAIVILEQENDCINYYYNSESDSSINKSILKNFLHNGFSYIKSTDTAKIAKFESDVSKILAMQPTQLNVKPLEPQNIRNSKYTFEDEPQVNVQSQNTTNRTSHTALKGHIAQLNAGTKINVFLQSGINTSTAAAGDEVIAILTDDLKYQNSVVAPQGSLVYGKLKTAKSAGYAMRNAKVVIDFYKIVTTEGNTYNISTEEIDFAVEGENKTAKAAVGAIGLAALGALLGLVIAAGSTSSSNYNRHYYENRNRTSSSSGNIGAGTAIGAGIGAAVGVASAIGQKGADAEIPAMTQIELTLTQPLNVSVIY